MFESYIRWRKSIQLCCSLEFIYDYLMKSQFLLEETKESRLNFFYRWFVFIFLAFIFQRYASNWNESFFFSENKKMVPVESHLERWCPHTILDFVPFRQELRLDNHCLRHSISFAMSTKAHDFRAAILKIEEKSAALYIYLF